MVSSVTRLELLLFKQFGLPAEKIFTLDSLKIKTAFISNYFPLVSLEGEVLIRSPVSFKYHETGLRSRTSLLRGKVEGSRMLFFLKLHYKQFYNIFKQ